MRGFFETKIGYFDQDQDKTVTQLYLVEALTFTEAEANITTYLTDFDIKDFDIKSISKNAYSDLVYRVGDDEYEWYEAKVSVKQDGDKTAKYKFLIAGKSVKDATVQVTKHVSDSEGKPTVTQVKIRDVEDLVIKKTCEMQGTIIVGFIEQVDLEERIS